MGEFDTDGRRQCFADIVNQLKSADISEFAVLVALSEWVISPSDFTYMFQDIRPVLRELGQKYEVLVDAQSAYKKWKPYSFFDGFKDELAVKYLGSVMDAKSWLKE